MKVSELVAKFKSEHSHFIELGMRVMGLGLSEYVAAPIEGDGIEAYVHPMFSSDDHVPMHGIIQVIVPIVFDHVSLGSDWNGHSIEYSVDFGFEDEGMASIHEVAQAEVPKEFQGIEDLPWDEALAPWRYEAFVDRCASDIKTLFGKPNWSKPELLNALAFGDFENHRQQCEEMKLKRLGLL